MTDIEQKRVARRKRLGTDEAGPSVVSETKTAEIINANEHVPQPALFEIGHKHSGWVLTDKGWEYGLSE